MSGRQRRGGVRLAAWMAALAVLMVTGGRAEGSDPGLEGKVFVGHTGYQGAGASNDDEIVFRDGRFLSVGCTAYGFGDAPYRSWQAEDGAIRFEAVTHSPKHGQMDWNGQVVGDRMEATYTWTKQRWYWFDARETLWFKGRLKE